MLYIHSVSLKKYVFRENNIIPLALSLFWGRPVHLSVICINKNINT